MDAATIAEMNRVRVSLGMKPLPVPNAVPSQNDDDDASSSEEEEDPASTIENRQAQSYENYNKIQEAEKAKKKREERAAAIRRARELAQRNALLEGVGLGEEDKGGDVDAKAWLTGQKKRQKKIDKARKMEEELAAAEAAAAAAVQYTSKDLAGIKVAHDSGAFLDGDDQILTLKDATIGENEDDEDELENIEMRDQEKLTERLDLKKKRPGYNPMDDEDEERGILSHYDEEIDGKKTKKFTLDADGAIAELGDILGKTEQKSQKLQSFSLDDVVGDAPASSDYLDASTIKVKKPKKKKKNKRTLQRLDDDDEIAPAASEAPANDAMEVDEQAPRKKRKTEDDLFVDDDDLQASLAMQRRKALKKRKKVRFEEIAAQLREEDSRREEPDENQEGGLVIGEVSEFLAGLSKPDEEPERKPKRPKPTSETSKSPEPDGDHKMEDEPAQELEEPSAPAEDDDSEVEKTIGGGMGETMALLRERGLLGQTGTAEDYENAKAREEFLAHKRILEESLDEETRKQRERDRQTGRFDRSSQREREEHARQQNQWREHQQSKAVQELFSKSYKPSFELKYTDEHGRSLDQKEAFKHLSHQFHGKGSGKGKTEKLLKKIGDEKRREAQSLFDASQNGGMSVAAAQQIKKRKEAGVRLG